MTYVFFNGDLKEAEKIVDERKMKELKETGVRNREGECVRVEETDIMRMCERDRK